MAKKVFIASSTPRRNGNSEVLAAEFARGAREAGHIVNKVDIRDLKLQFCSGCLSCQVRGSCVLNDSMNGLYDEIQSADILVFATPIYFYEMSGQLKTFLDRLNPLYGRENRFKEVYLLATAADEDPAAMNRAISGLQGWIDCFAGVRLAQTICGAGATEAGVASGSAAAAEAYKAGLAV